jgi:hypothetical protein
MITRIWHGATPASKSDEYLNLMRTVAIPDYRSPPGNKGAYALRCMGERKSAQVIKAQIIEDTLRARTLG